MPETVIREVAGQVDPAAKWIYSYPRLAAKRVAVGALSAVKVGKSEEGHVTNHVTKALCAASADVEAIEKSGRGAQI